MIINGEDGDESKENIKEQKMLELERRRDDMIKRSDKKRHQRYLHEQRRDALKAEALLQSHNVADERLIEIRQTYLLAEELSRRKREDVKKWLASDKGSPAYNPSHCEVEKIRAQMIQEKVRQESHTVDVVNQWYSDNQYDVRKREEAIQKKLEYRRDLQNQMIDNRMRMREKAEEKQRERKMMEEVADRVHEEDVQLEIRKRETAAVLRAEEKAFLNAREIWKDKRMELLRKEHEDIERMVAEKELQARQLAEKKSDINAAREETSFKIAEKIRAEEKKNREREQLWHDLYVAQKDNEVAEEAARSILEKNRVARELLSDMERSHKAAVERRAKEKEIDAAFAKYDAEQRSAEEEKEKQKHIAREENRMHYGRELRKTIMQNKVQHALDILQTQAQSKQQRANLDQINARETVIPMLARS